MTQTVADNLLLFAGAIAGGYFAGALLVDIVVVIAYFVRFLR